MNKTKKRVLLAAPYGKDTGGIARWTEHILSYYQLHHDEVVIDLLPTGRKDVGKIRSNLLLRVFKGIKVYRDKLNEEKKMIGIKAYDVFHLTSSASFGLFKDYLMLRMVKKKGIKTIIHFRFGRIPELSGSKNWEWRMLNKVILLSDCVIVLDEKSYKVLLNEGYNHIVKLPNPISPRVLDIIARNGDVKRIERNILFVGHGYWDKGIKELILACRDIANVKVVMIGSIEETIANELKRLTGDSQWLEIKGDTPYEDVIRAMMECAVFVLPTYTEGFPNVILEAMASGCPIVTTDVGAIPEMLDIEKGNENGICVKPRDVAGLREAILQMLNNREYAQKCGANAMKRVNEMYSMPIIWNKLLSIWEAFS